VNELLDEIKVDNYEFLVIGKGNLVVCVKLKQTLYSFQEHSEVWSCIGAADLRFVYVYFER